MNSKGKIILPILIVLIIIFVALAAFIFNLYQKEYAQNVKLQGQLVELENRQKQTAAQLEESKKNAADLELQLQEAKNRIDGLAKELGAEKAAHVATSGQLEQLKGDLSSQKSLREELEGRLNQVQEESKQIREEIKIMQQQKSALEEKIKNLEEGAAKIELGTVVVNPETAGASSEPAIAQSAASAMPVSEPITKAVKPAKAGSQLVARGQEGKVLIVNKEFNFVVINLGSKDKVSVGDEFSVSRAGKPIGDVKVEKVHEFMSAAGFAEQLRDSIKENDKVTQRTR
jgi:hypothetical protein